MYFTPVQMYNLQSWSKAVISIRLPEVLIVADISMLACISNVAANVLKFILHHDNPGPKILQQ